MIKTNTIPLLIWASILLLISAGCSKSDEQREFENGALATPSGITESNAGGDITGNKDADDWRIAPMYRGLIQVGFSDSPAPHPNPLDYNENLTLQIKFNASEPVNAIEIRKFRLPSDAQYAQLRFFQQDELSTFNTFTIEGKTIAETAGSEGSDIYRLLIYDSNQNMISYGDVRIQ